MGASIVCTSASLEHSARRSSQTGWMPTEIERGQVQELVGHGARLVEVLPPEEYEDDHIPGAISIPLKDLDSDSVVPLERTSPVVVYCWDTA